MTTGLKLLKPQARQVLSTSLVSGDQANADLNADADEFVRTQGPTIDLEPVKNIFKKAMELHTGRKADSDAWLAPRLHATLRLTRREAADRRIWDYLAVGPFREYVFWRWGTDGDGSKKFLSRFFGTMRDHAIARLWWGAELTRNGPSYECTKLFFSNTDVPNSWINLRAFRHRPASVAAVKFIYHHKVEGVPIGDTHRILWRAYNAALTTTVLEAVAPHRTSPPAAIEEWIAEEIDETLYFKNDPTGPPESPVSEKDVTAVTNLLARIAKNTKFEKRARKGSGKSASGEVIATTS